MRPSSFYGQLCFTREKGASRVRREPELLGYLGPLAILPTNSGPQLALLK